jgi:hypothetical protein
MICASTTTATMTHHMLNPEYSYISFIRVVALKLVINFQTLDTGIYPLSTFSPITNKIIKSRTMRWVKLVRFNGK